RTGWWLVENRAANRDDFYPSRAFKTEMTTACPVGPEPELSLRASAPLLSAVDSWTRSLGGRAPSALSADHWRGSVQQVVICAPRESDTFDIAIDVETAVAKAEVIPDLALWGWRRWTMIVVALFLACWWTVGLRPSRVARPVTPRAAAPEARDRVQPELPLVAG